MRYRCSGGEPLGAVTSDDISCGDGERCVLDGGMYTCQQGQIWKNAAIVQ